MVGTRLDKISDLMQTFACVQTLNHDLRMHMLVPLFLKLRCANRSQRSTQTSAFHFATEAFSIVTEFFTHVSCTASMITLGIAHATIGTVQAHLHAEDVFPQQAHLHLEPVCCADCAVRHDSATHLVRWSRAFHCLLPSEQGWLETTCPLLQPFVS